ncbi:MAG TPA: Rieske 2Fe-2S domain-containing protein [Nitriliruptorales bacterium]|nr:Rieske 2Fe-2S domain-containing protein [Nitriliruptorales bacterium]
MSAVSATRRLVAVAPAAELPPGTAVRLVADGCAIAVLHHRDGLHAVDAACTHAAGPLVEGTLTGGCQLVCPWHAAVFDARTGEVLRGPARKRLRTYHVFVRDGTVYIEL